MDVLPEIVWRHSLPASRNNGEAIGRATPASRYSLNRHVWRHLLLLLLAETSIDDLGHIFRLGSYLCYECGSIRDEIDKRAVPAISMVDTSTLQVCRLDSAQLF